MCTHTSCDTHTGTHTHVCVSLSYTPKQEWEEREERGEENTLTHLTIHPSQICVVCRKINKYTTRARATRKEKTHTHAMTRHIKEEGDTSRHIRKRGKKHKIKEKHSDRMANNSN
jgi:hypothetical protein